MTQSGVGYRAMRNGWRWEVDRRFNVGVEGARQAGFAGTFDGGYGAAGFGRAGEAAHSVQCGAECGSDDGGRRWPRRTAGAGVGPGAAAASRLPQRRGAQRVHGPGHARLSGRGARANRRRCARACMGNVQFLADGHHVDEAGNLICCTYVCRPSAGHGSSRGHSAQWWPSRSARRGRTVLLRSAVDRHAFRTTHRSQTVLPS